MAYRRVTAFVALALLPAMLSAQSKPRSKAEQDRIKQSASKFSLDLPPSEDPPPPVTLNPPPTEAVAAPVDGDTTTTSMPAEAPASDITPDAAKAAAMPADVPPAAADEATPNIGADNAVSDAAIAPADIKPAADDSTMVPESAATATTPLASAATGPFTLDTPIIELIADPRAKAVLDKDMPGLSGDKNLDKFKYLSLRKFQPLTGGQLTDDLLNATGNDLAAISSGAPMPQPKRSKPVDER